MDTSSNGANEMYQDSSFSLQHLEQKQRSWSSRSCCCCYRDPAGTQHCRSWSLLENKKLQHSHMAGGLLIHADTRIAPCVHKHTRLCVCFRLQSVFNHFQPKQYQYTFWVHNKHKTIQPSLFCWTYKANRLDVQILSNNYEYGDLVSVVQL